MPVISGAVEGDIDEAVFRRLVHHVKCTPGTVYGKRGKNYIRQKISAFNQAARLAPWCVIVDLDQDFDCAPPLRSIWLPQVARLMCFRVAVREVESWLLADRDRMAAFLGVPIRKIPLAPESLSDPKRTVVDLARRSRRRYILENMVPREASGRSVGPAYNSRLIEFASNHECGWRPEVAARYSDSLSRTLQCLRNIAGATQ